MKITSTTFVAGCSLLLLCLAGAPTTVRADLVSDGAQDMEAMDFVVSAGGDDMMTDAEAEENVEVFHVLSQKIGTFVFISCAFLTSRLYALSCVFKISFQDVCPLSLPFSFQPKSTMTCFPLPFQSTPCIHSPLLIASHPPSNQTQLL